jgi:histidinol-phosphate phosphatase family protein
MTRAIVIPTVGRPSLRRLLWALADERIVVVDDRRDRRSPLQVPDGVRVLDGPRRGPAAARNAGWRAVRADWIVFLDDDVVPGPGWRAALGADLRTDAGASQGRIVVPLAAGRRPTDWERNVAGLERARWATADMAYRRDALAAAGGFDERFPRAYREDADLGLRTIAAGRRIERGARLVIHPVGEGAPGISLAKQAGNADDVLMRALHGRRWRERAGVPRGRRPRHLAIAAAGVLALGAAGARRPGAAAVAGATWALGTIELAAARIAPGPRTPAEIATMAWTSALLPFAAAAWWLRGLAGLPRKLRAGGPRPWPAAVLLDRDGTLIEDVPYNGDPARVVPVPAAGEALARLREAGVPTAIVSNQSGVARGLLTHADVLAVHGRMTELLGPLGPLEYCPHGPDDGCACRKPAPGLVLRAAGRLGVRAAECALIGDIGADVDAARAAGARAILVPTPRTRAEEVAAAPERAGDLAQAVAILLGDRA